MTSQELSKLRADMGLTIRQLADHLGVHWNTVNKWQMGQRKIPEMAVKLLQQIKKS